MPVTVTVVVGKVAAAVGVEVGGAVVGATVGLPCITVGFGEGDDDGFGVAVGFPVGLTGADVMGGLEGIDEG